MTRAEITRVEFYTGALQGDDRDPANPESTAVWFGDGYTRYPNAMGSQAGGTYLAGPSSLSDASPNTGIRISSAWAANWAIVFDGAVLNGSTSIPIFIDVTSVYGDPADTSEQFHDIEVFFFDWGTDHFDLNPGGQTAYAETTTRVPVGTTTTIEWVINSDWLTASHANDGNNNDAQNGSHWHQSDASGENEPHSLEDFVSDLTARPGSQVAIQLGVGDGAFPYEVQITRVQVGETRPAIEARGLKNRQRFF